MVGFTDIQIWYNDIFSEADPRTKNWFLVNNSIVPALSVVLIYLLTVATGSRLMKNREPFQLGKIIIFYNLALVNLFTYISVEIYLSIRDANYDFLCDPYNEQSRKNPKDIRVAAVIWIYYISKFIELFDTVFMVLRKKASHISFLHLIHHTGVIFVFWIVMMFMPGGAVWFVCFANSIVHIAMYSYYGFSAIPSCRRVRRWKKYLTQLQLVQFLVLVIFDLNGMVNNCDYPVVGYCLQIGFPLLMFFLFLNFYIQSYILEKTSTTEANSIRAKKNETCPLVNGKKKI